MDPLTLNEFGDRMVELLPRLMQEITRHENNYVTTGKITLPQLLVLEYLSHHQGCHMNAVASATNTSFSTATGMVDRLVKHGLVKRVPGQDDRRTVCVSITAKGRRILNEVYEQKRSGIVRLFSRISADEREEYLEILEKLVHNLSTQSKGARSPHETV